MKNADTRLSKLEQSVKQASPAYDWLASPTYAAMLEADRHLLTSFADRFNADGLGNFSDEELNEFERLIFPFAREEQADGQYL